MSAIPQPFPEAAPAHAVATAVWKDEAFTLAADYRCKACGGRARVDDTVSAKHELGCRIAARILQMRIGGA